MGISVDLTQPRKEAESVDLNMGQLKTIQTVGEGEPTNRSEHSRAMKECPRLDKENVAHIHHGILCSHKKGLVHVLCWDMDEAGNQHTQQINTGTEKQTQHVLIDSGS